MKKTLTLVSAMLIVGHFSFAQIASDNIDVNNIDALVNSESDLFWNPASSSAKFEVPKGSGHHAIFAGNVWMGGMDSGNQLHLAAESYGSGSGSTDYFAGPIASNYDLSYDLKYNRVWKITSDQVDNHIANYDQIGYVMPEVIANWPAHGDVNNGEAEELAPFVDVNGNNIYDPVNGDYPSIRGDMSIYSIFNDIRESHTSSQAEALGVEVHCMVYAFDEGGAVGNTVFVNYSIFNRSISEYQDFYLGTWYDFDLGDALDDFVGSDPSRNLFYCYNGDNNDVDGYGENPPAVGCVFLSTDLNAFAYYNQGGVATGEPSSGVQYYNYMQGIWLDGSGFVEGGNGHVAGGGDVNSPTNFMFNGDPTDGSGWSEVSAQNASGDRRGLGSVGPFDLPKGAVLCIDLALVYASSEVSNLASVNSLKSAVDDVQNFYDLAQFECNDLEIDAFDFYASESYACVNQSIDFINASVGDALNYKWFFDGGTPNFHEGTNPPSVSYASEGNYDVTMRVYIVGGDSIDIVKTNYINIESPVAIGVDGVNFSFEEPCPGDLVTISPDNPQNVGPQANYRYYMVGDTSDIELANSTSPTANVTGLYDQDEVFIEITGILGCYSDNQDEASSLVDYEVDFGELDIVVHGDRIECVSPTGNINYDWFLVIGQNEYELTGQESSVLYPPASNRYYRLAATMNESPFCTVTSDTIYFLETSVATNTMESTLEVYPNPTQGKLFINGATIGDQITLIDVTGKVVLSETAKNKLTQLNVNGLAKGVYHLRLISDGMSLIEKVIIE